MLKANNSDLFSVVAKLLRVLEFRGVFTIGPLNFRQMFGVHFIRFVVGLAVLESGTLTAT